MIAGCGGPEAQAGAGPYSADIARAQKSATSDFERTALADGAVSREEYTEAVQRYVKCLTDRGFDMDALDSGYGFFTYRHVDQPGFDAAEPQCREGTVEFLEPLYTGMLINPARRAFPDLVAECLVRKKLAPSGYTGQRFEADGKAEYRNAPYKPDDPQVQACLANPSLQ